MAFQREPKMRLRLIFIICLSLLYPVIADANTPFVLVIDPGHGGKDSGAVGSRAKEKDVNLAVSLLVGQYIKQEHPNVKVIYTRDKDVFIGLNERADIANKANANLFISIHSNAVKNRSVKGAEVFTLGLSRSEESKAVAKRENAVIVLEDNYEQKYEGFDPNSSESYIIFEFMQNKYVEQSVHFASLVQERLVSHASRGNRGVKQAEYLVLRRASMPRVLVELDFISNAEAERYISSKKGQQEMARSISNAFAIYKGKYDQQENIMTAQAVTSTSSQEGKQELKRVYKVQILTSGSKLPENSPLLKGQKADYYVENGTYKYTVGESSDPDEIAKLRKTLQSNFKDAFVVAFENGNKVKR